MQVRCTVQLEASFAAAEAAVGAIILLLSPFMMTLAVDVLTHSIHMLRPWFSSMLRIIITPNTIERDYHSDISFFHYSVVYRFTRAISKMNII